MVIKQRPLVIWILFVFGAAPAYAAGVIYDLPEDRAWVRFEGDLTSAEGQPSSSTIITISSVGQVTVGDEMYRWIEMRIEFNEDGSKKPVTIMKGLFPEDQLQLGGDPMKGLLRAWEKTGDAAPTKLIVPEAGRDARFQMHERFLMLLRGPLEEVEKLDKRVTDSALGNLECDGLIGHFRTQHDQIDVQLTYELRLHDKAPFGVVSVRFTYDAKRGETALATGTMNLKLAALGTDAKSELPNSQ